jgi:hypothetical protein
MRFINEQNIISDLKSRSLWGREYNYFFYGAQMPGALTFGLLGPLSLFDSQPFIVNFNESGLVLIGLDMMGEVNEKAILTIKREDIRSFTISRSVLWGLGLNRKVNIELSDNSKLVLQVSKIAFQIKDQWANINNIKKMFGAKQ